MCMKSLLEKILKQVEGELDELVMRVDDWKSWIGCPDLGCLNVQMKEMSF